MQHRNNNGQRFARARRLTDAEATNLGVKMLERLSRRIDRDGVVARVMRAVNSMCHQAAGTVDAAVTLTQLSPEDARRLTEMAAEIVRDKSDGRSAKC